MIKINLAKVKKTSEERSIAVDIKAIKSLKIQELLKAGTEYYAGLVLWIGALAVLGYYWKINQNINSLRAELNRLNAEKAKIQKESSSFLEEKKFIEEKINRIKQEIQDIERSKDIISGLKAYYQPFNSGFLFYTTYVPGASWVSSYKQSLDLENQTLLTELEINSLDYAGISNYGQSLAKGSRKLMLTQVERKLNLHGFEYYSVKLNAERSLQEGR